MSSTSIFEHTLFYPSGLSEELIVFLHGWGPFTKKHVSAIAKVITGEDLNISETSEKSSNSILYILFALFILFCLYFSYILWTNSWSLNFSSVIDSIKSIVSLIIRGLSVLLVMFFCLVGSFILALSTNPASEEAGDDAFAWNDSLGSLMESVSKALPDADLLVPFYDAAIFSNADAFLLASRLDELLQSKFEERQKRGREYKKIILVGHSIGALIIRKAYMYGLGATEDHPVYMRTTKQRPWTTRVERLILLAPMNRGWSLSPKPKHMTWINFIFYSFIMGAGQATGSARLVRSLKRGTGFVSNLRLQWTRMCVAQPDAVAPVILLLGDTDDMVSQDDHQDILASSKFIFIPVPSSGHASIVKFHEGEIGQIRTSKFLKALSQPIAMLQNEFQSDTRNIETLPIKIQKAYLSDDLKQAGDVVFILHGIRDFGHWTAELKNEIKRLNDNTKIITSGYGYFPILRFLFLGSRRRNVLLFMDWYTESIVSNPGREISFVGHSNGSYILSSALENYATVKIKNIALLGSIMPRKFPWDAYVAEGRVKAIRNDVASDDWVVGVFGSFFEFFSENLAVTMGTFGEIGTSGFHGFTNNAAHEFENKFFSGGHGAALSPTNFSSLAKFLVSGHSNVDSNQLASRQSNWIIWLSKFSVLLIIAATGFIIAIGFWIVGIIQSLVGLGVVSSWLAFCVLLAVLLFVF
ncbi:alpha/beta hydrolase [Methylocystis sp. SC2]|uniref:alpha/beta hydrolase n=1 Tax=Methylocystis sp. (strain SC2) TaxID=187303 RepID=UPI00027AEA21|nr:alpha/beta hydrolase [Methylocystis sp. SC2]CCJ07990.1 Putative response regulator receiver protein [Methylocystis sp. SC2]